MAPTASSPGAFWVVMSSNSLVVYLKTSFSAQKHCGSRTLRTPLSSTFGLGPLGSRLCPS
jgi:hypothetical protein